MKNVLFIAMAVLLTSNANASHFCNQVVNIEITHVENLDRMNGVSVRRGYVGGPFEVIRDHEQIITVEVTQVSSTSGHSCGLIEGSTRTLHVKKEQIDAYKVDDKLTMHYSNVGDAMGSRISWQTIK